MTAPHQCSVTQGDRDAAAKVYGLNFAWADYSSTSRCAQIRRGEWDMLGLVQAFARCRVDALEAATKVCDQQAKQHAESFRKEVILKNQDRQTHFAARHREAEELATAIRILNRIEAMGNVREGV